MSVSSLRNHPRLTVATVLLVAVASLAAWQRTDAVGQESADKTNPAALDMPTCCPRLSTTPPKLPCPAW